MNVHNHAITTGTFGQNQEWKLGDPATYQHPLIPEDVLMDKSGLEVLLAQTSLGRHDSAASGVQEEPEEETVEEKVEEEEEEEDTVERLLPDDMMAITDVGSVSQ